MSKADDEDRCRMIHKIADDALGRCDSAATWAACGPQMAQALRDIKVIATT